jgi:hypothetical protein
VSEAEPSSQPPIFPTSPLQLEVGPQDQGGSMVPRALKMQHRRPDPPLKAGDLDFYVPPLPTRYLLGLVPNRLDV